MLGTGWKRIAIGLAATPALLATGLPSFAAPQRVPPMRFGMNLGILRYWSQEFPFIDIIKSAQIKVVNAKAGWTDAEGVIPMDATGHPVNVPAGTTLAVIVKSGGGDRLPSGAYDCRISPGWNVLPSNVAKIAPRPGGFNLQVKPSPASGGLTFKLTPSTSRASLATFSCRAAGAPPDAIFNPVFLDDMRPFSVIRFMDWMKTNNQPSMRWETRTIPASFSQANDRGASVEYMVALANRLKADPWFTLPLDADPAYYRHFASYVHDHLAPDRKAYVEVSNEVWNGLFQQSKQATARGKALYPGATDTDANDFYYADRVRAVMTIWSDVFHGQRGRLVRVLSSQAGSTHRPTTALSHNDTARFVDALAIAPYFGPDRGQPPVGVDATEYLLTHGDDFIANAIRRGVASKAVADRFSLTLVTYEGGPDYVSFKPRLKEAFLRAERDPRIYAIYQRFLDRWQREVGGLYIAYDAVNQRFGHKLYTGQPLGEAPKMRALIDFMKRQRAAR